MNRKILIAAVALTAMGSLSACGSSGLLDRNRPDEFAVTRETPLAIPTDYTLPAPQPGAADNPGQDSKQQVLDAMFGTTAAAPRN